MPFKKGQSGNPYGRPRGDGSGNVSKRILGAVRDALDKVDLTSILVKEAKDNPTAFLKFVGKMTPNASEIMQLEERDKLDEHAKSKELTYDQRLKRLNQITGVTLHDHHNAND